MLFPHHPPKVAITSFETTPGSCAGVGGQAMVLMMLMVHEKKYVLHELWSVKQIENVMEDLVFLHIPTPPLQGLLKPAHLLRSQQQCLVGQLVLLGHLQYSMGAGKLLEVQEQVEIAMCSALSSLTPQCSEPNYGTMLILFFFF